MCGIVGILGREPVAGQMVDALKRLEYRGYDSAGVATLEGGHARRAAAPKASSRTSKQRLHARAARRHDRHRPYALGDARPPERNQRPSARHRPRRGRPQRHHREFPRAARGARSARAPSSRPRPTPRSSPISSPHEMKNGTSPADAVAAALPRLRGAFALAFLFEGEDDLLIGARKGSPLAVGYGDGEMYLGSDAIALAPFTDAITYLEDGDWVVLTAHGAQVRDAAGTHGQAHGASSRSPRRSWSTRATTATSWRRRSTSSRKWSATRSRITSTWRPSASRCRCDCRSTSRKLERISISACGTAYYAGLVAKYWFERFARLPVEIDVASEFRYREAPLRPGGLRDLRLAVGRDRRHAGDAALRQGAQAARRSRSSTCRPRHRARKRRGAADARRPRDRRRLDQGVHLPARGAGLPRDRGRPRARRALATTTSASWCAR